MSDEIVDLEVARYALRTFHLLAGGAVLSSISVNGRVFWDTGTCEAECIHLDGAFKKYSHSAPHPGCTCGIYGCLSLEALARQYPVPTQRIVAVIAAEGSTILGSIGLRTQRARVVAFWGWDELVRAVARKQFVGAREYRDMYPMLTTYQLPMHSSVYRPDLLIYDDYAVFLRMSGTPGWWEEVFDGRYDFRFRSRALRAADLQG